MSRHRAFLVEGPTRSTLNRMLGILLIIVTFEAVPTYTSEDVEFTNPKTIEGISKSSQIVANELKPNPETSKLNSTISSVEHTLQRKSRALPLFENLPNIDAKDVEGKDSVQKLPTKSRYGYVIPYIRPGKKDSEKTDGNEISNMKPILNNEELIMAGARTKRSFNMIPNVRFGRTLVPSLNSKKTQNTLIPMARYGRDTEVPVFSEEPELHYDPVDGEILNTINAQKLENELEIEEAPNFLDYAKQDLDEEINSRSIKQNTGDTDYVIPYPRLGKSTSENVPLNVVSSSDDDSLSIIPQIRYGRSVSILSIPKTDVVKQSDIPNLILPYPRPGRSEPISSESKKSVGIPDGLKINSKVINIEDDIDKYGNNRIKKESFMLPYARLGRSGKAIFNKINEKNFDTDEKIPIPFLQLNFSISSEDSPEHLLEPDEKDTFFIIPYPRPGKRTITRKSLIPNTRFGRSVLFPNDQTKMSKSEDHRLKEFVLPYPRPGKRRALAYNFAGDDYYYGASESTDDEENNMEEIENLFNFLNSGLNVDENDGEKIIRKRSIKSMYMLPSFRPGRSLLPIPRPGRSLLPIPRPGRSLLPIPRPGRSLLPIPRPGRSLLPIPRPGRSLLPIPRPGKSEGSKFVLPYPRPGRSANVILPYPRPGRKISELSKQIPAVLDDEADTSSYSKPIISNMTLPLRFAMFYIRPGRSSIDNDSFSRANSRNKRKASDNEGFFVPYPRPGRSFSALLPYPRPGRSSSNGIPIPPYSKYEQYSDVRNLMPKENLEMAITSSKSFVLPYPRPGRSSNLRNLVPNLDPTFHNFEYSREFSMPYFEENMAPQSKFSDDGNDSAFHLEDVSKKSTIVPYPRPGRSTKGYVLPYPRMGRRDIMDQSVNKNNDKESGLYKPDMQMAPKEVIPKYAHKLHKHMLTSSANYILPYPRPGRFTE
ncbi:uncharacterized protein LOC129230343 [Uloborus diversus]|uniref:uncharacterized protein LOC129230343 n=1 Tax=Uloborus diversus TaxID=327109 RepID=UPI002409B02C|nr:uncharacterized protein LOC129230343 [Uloborus diversus]